MYECSPTRNETLSDFSLFRKLRDMSGILEYNTINFHLSGGEPFFVPDLLVKIIENINRYFPSANVVVTTNLISITSRILDFLKNNPWIKVEVSFDPYLRTFNSSFREYLNIWEEKYAELSTIRQFAPVGLVANRLLYKFNIKDFLIRNRIRTIFLEPLIPVGRARDLRDIMFTMDELMNLYWMAYHVLPANVYPTAGLKNGDFFCNDEPAGHFIILPDGTIGNCLMKFSGEGIYGNIFQQKVEDIINSKNYLYFIMKKKLPANNCVKCLENTVCSRCFCLESFYRGSICSGMLPLRTLIKKYVSCECA